MDQKQILKQMIQFNKSTFDNSYSAMAMVQEQNEKLIGTFVDQAAWLPEEGRKLVKEWMATSKKACDDFKNSVDQSYKRIEDFFSL
jgi:polyhydroxyalkanoate synthesis regulator phasin